MYEAKRAKISPAGTHRYIFSLLDPVAGFDSKWDLFTAYRISRHWIILIQLRKLLATSVCEALCGISYLKDNNSKDDRAPAWGFREPGEWG